jgi:hypothetical protein
MVGSSTRPINATEPDREGNARTLISTIQFSLKISQVLVEVMPRSFPLAAAGFTDPEEKLHNK